MYAEFTAYDPCEVPIVFPPVPECEDTPEQSEVAYLFVINEGDGMPVSGWADGGEVTADETSTALVIPVIGNVGEPEEITGQLSGGKTVVALRKYTLTCTFPTLRNPAFRNIVKKFEESKTKGYKVLYGTLSHIYGKDGGIPLTMVNGRLPLNEGEGSMETGTAILQWTTKQGSPERTANNPYAG